MEEITEGVANMGVYDTHKKNRIQVSNTKKPLFFYVNLAKVILFLSLSSTSCFLGSNLHRSVALLLFEHSVPRVLF